MPTRMPNNTTNKPIKLRNLISDERTVDNLHMKYKNNNQSHACNETRCLGSMLNPRPVEQRVRTGQETWDQAKDFIDNYYTSIKRFDTQAHKNRLKEVEQQIKSTDTYYLKETELIYGAKLAWRNAPRCIGRIQWSKLQVFDARFTRNAEEMFEAICNHIKYSTNKGSLRSAITIFPQRVKSVQNDWRIWNSQLINYAGYRDKETGKLIAGDAANADITEICQRLGWKSSGGDFDILPLVLSANGGPPQMFTLPEDLVLRVKLRHPKYNWFAELGLEWYALPAVASMMLDVGGLQFTACPFSGWYMVTEIGTRDLGDVNRYNKLELVAQKMGLNTKTNMTLWKDQAVVELNIAVLDSFQHAGVTIVDHHTASETFMTHLANEQRLRGGCPADWIWLVPPTAGSTTQVFHQEMVNYHLLPNYEYMDSPWRNFDWNVWEKQEAERKLQAEALRKKKAALVSEKLAAAAAANNTSANINGASPAKTSVSLLLSSASKSPSTISNHSLSPGSTNGSDLTPRHLRFKEIARAVKFTSKLFGKALSRRIKATILYATETGKSERFANKLAQTFSYAFNVHLMSMADYDMTCLEHEALLLIVTSTFGNGDPPENGELFAKHLAAIKLTGDTSPDIESINSVSTNPFFQMLSEDHSSSTGGGFMDGPGSRSANDSCVVNNSFDSSISGTILLNHLENGDSGADFGDKPKKHGGLEKLQLQQATTTQLQPQQQSSTTNVRPLSNVRFAVFALGSTAYPHFCAFGRYVDQTLGELGAERILKCSCGDELCGQEKAFNEWSSEVFKVACDVFCLTDQLEPGIVGGAETIWSPADVRFELANENDIVNKRKALENNGQSIEQLDINGDTHINSINHGSNNKQIVTDSKHTIVQNLVGIVGKKIIPFTVKHRIDLHQYRPEENLQTICVDLDSGVRPIKFQPGDHVGIYPTNKQEVVQKILDRIGRDFGFNNDGKNSDTNSNKSINPKNGHHLALDSDRKLTILVKRGNMDPLTQADDWIPCDTLPPIISLREALTRYLDITNSPNQEFLLILSRMTTNQDEKKRLQQMARNFTVYEEWKIRTMPSLLNVLEEFTTVKFDPTLVTQIPPMKPRFYSISGLSLSLTLSVVRYHTLSGEYREGLCSNHLNETKVGPRFYVYGYVRSAPAFHMPQEKTVPMILICAGTGIAPFRSFWQQRYADIYGENTLNRTKTAAVAMKELTTSGLKITDENGGNIPVGGLIPLTFGPIDLYFGCRNANYVLYKDELDEMRKSGILTSVNVAFSRPMSGEIVTSSIDTKKPDALSTSNDKPFRKMYVQDKLLENSADVFKSIASGAHIYVCGDVAMADGVYKTLAIIINQNLKLSRGCNGEATTEFTIGDDGETALMNLRNFNRYHEDIFGARR